MAGYEDLTAAVQGLREAAAGPHPELRHLSELFATTKAIIDRSVAKGGAAMGDLEDLVTSLSQLTTALTAAVDQAKNPPAPEPGART